MSENENHAANLNKVEGSYILKAPLLPYYRILFLFIHTAYRETRRTKGSKFNMRESLQRLPSKVDSLTSRLQPENRSNNRKM